MSRFSPSWIVFEEEIGGANLNLLGYGLLAMFICSVGEVLATAAFLDPSWEFEAAGRFADISWAFVLGVALVIRRTAGQSSWAWEAKLMRRLSQACIVFAILYIALIGITWSAFTRLAAADRAQAQAVVKSADEQFRSVRQAIAAADSMESLQKAVVRLGSVSVPGQPLDAVKAQIVSQIEERKRAEGEKFTRDIEARGKNRLFLAWRMIAQSLIMALVCFGLFHFRNRQQPSPEVSESPVTEPRA